MLKQVHDNQQKLQEDEQQLRENEQQFEKKQSTFGRTNGRNKKAPRIGQEANKSSEATRNCLHLSYEAMRQGKRSNWQACKNA